MKPLQPSSGFGPDTASPQVEAIRGAMLEALGWPVPRGCEALMLRVKHAVGAERLWYLREELMQALAWIQGEARAAERIARISALFQGLLPPSLVSSHRTR